MMSVPVLVLDALEVGYRTGRGSVRVVLGPVSETLHAGELICVLGANGAGKSTLMRTMAGLQSPVRGRVMLDGRDLHGMRPAELARRVSIVLTERIEGGLLNARELVALGRQPHTGWLGQLGATDRRVVDEALRLVGAEGLAHRKVAELSDGERQKVMVARAFAQEPEAMILDEITAFLDLPRRVEIMRILARLAHDHGRAILLSTHDLELALHTADRIWLVKDGTLLSGVPEELVISGRLEAAFVGDHVTFDQERGSFRPRPEVYDSITFTGDGLAATWTRRAIERRGFQVIDGGTAPGRVHVEVDGSDIGRLSWKVVRGNEETSHTTLSSLLDSLAADLRLMGATNR